MADPDPPREWVLRLPWQKPPLSMNGRQHWAVKQRLTTSVRMTAHWLAVGAHIPPCDRVRITLHYVPRDRRRRDELNLVATLKACEDGIVDAGVIPDDTARYSEPTMPVIDPADPADHPTGRLYLHIADLEGIR